MKLCFGQWGALGQECSACPDGQACVRDWVLGPLALVSLELGGGEGLAELAEVMGRPVEIVRGAIEHVLEGAPDLPNPLLVDAQEGVSRPARPERLVSRGTAVPRCIHRAWGNRWRWERERQRYPQLERLLPGTVLVRRWRAPDRLEMEDHQVVVLDFGYWYSGRRRPTLYSAMVEIVGRKEFRQSWGRRVPPGRRPLDPRARRAVVNWGRRAYEFFGLDLVLGPVDQQLVGGHGWRRGR